MAAGALPRLLGKSLLGKSLGGVCKHAEHSSAIASPMRGYAIRLTSARHLTFLTFTLAHLRRIALSSPLANLLLLQSLYPHAYRHHRAR